MQHYPTASPIVNLYLAMASIEEKLTMVTINTDTWYVPCIEYNPIQLCKIDSASLLEKNNFHVIKKVSTATYEVKPPKGWYYVSNQTGDRAIIYNEQQISKFELWEVIIFQGKKYFKNLSMLV